MLQPAPPPTGPGREALAQSPPSQSHAELLHALSQNLSVIQLAGHPSAHWGTGQDRNTWV